MFENCRPDIIVEGLERLDQDDLWQRGVRAILLDLDNTLCAWHRSDITPERREWLERAKARFRMCILSNTISSRRLRRVAADLGIPAVGRWGVGRKPFPGGFRAALRLVQTRPEETAMVGDQLFADILGGNRLGMVTVLVPKLTRFEFISTQLARMPERWVLRHLGCTIPAPAPPGGTP